MRIWKQAVISVVLLGAAAAVWARHFPPVAAFLERAGFAVASVESGGADAPRPPAGPGRAGAPVTVIGAEIAQATINDALAAIGDGRAARSVTVTPYASGRVAAIEAASGDFVGAGGPLVRLDSDTEEIALDRARLTLEDARATLARDQELSRSSTVSEVQLRQAQLAVDQADLAVRDAELTLERRTVRAPFAGWVGILGVEVGDQVDTGTEVATLDDRSHILVDFRVPERFIGQVQVGSPLTARPLARPSLQLAGKVVTVDSRIAADTRTLRVRASLDNSDDLLRAGMAFSIAMRFPGDTFPAVDPLAIQWGAEGAYVWTGADGRASRVPVRIVQRNDDYVLVDAELDPGTLVVTEGVQLLRPGAALRFENAPPDPTIGEGTPGERGEALPASAAPRKT